MVNKHGTSGLMVCSPYVVCFSSKLFASALNNDITMAVLVTYNYNCNIIGFRSIKRLFMITGSSFVGMSEDLISGNQES